MQYKDLVNLWVQQHSEPSPIYSAPDFPARDMAPGDINALENSQTAQDLYQRPIKSFNPSETATSAFAIGNNPKNQLTGNVDPMAIFAKGKASGQLSLMRDNSEVFNADQQGVYAHEIGHHRDERLNNQSGSPYPLNSNPEVPDGKGVNHFYKAYINQLVDRFTKQGVEDPEGMASEEGPAMVSENSFWKNVKSGMYKK